ncbi:hypothetical protein F4553_004798 [Allocatelliglobosispora scoriae]|uniref:DUF559 domain-containing protein n=1 Tax=Allocatelliglobosispora scoriae TaxID=643052 RepID=A0A841BW92_9ACTN|nr:DUF559 domain-containing protein [Allocatelliglobosispora scoriae]MBB5871419.1 hypothetical protein [Allocatelliglobosispora scoriae]
MPTPPLTPRELAVAPFRGSDAIARGLLTRGMLRSSAWRRLYRDVYVHEEIAIDHRVSCEAAALLLPPGAAVAGLSAAHVWGVTPLPVGDVTVIVPRGQNMRVQPGIEVRRGALPPSDIVSPLGFPVTSALRTAFDLARELPPTEAVIVLDTFLKKQRINQARLADYLDARPSWPGVKAARTALFRADPLSESPMETRTRLLIADSDLPMPFSQYKVYSGKRFIARVDFAYPDCLLALEYEGDHHRHRDVFRSDIERLNRMRLLGWTVLRFTADDILRYPDNLITQIRAALRRRRI